MDEIKKEIIIQEAKAHPFKTIHEIAEKANTTGSYVRTVLSEAGISLTQMRKEKYFELRRKLDEQVALRNNT